MPQLKRYEREFVFRGARTPINVLRTVHHGVEEPHDHDFVEVVLIAGGTAIHRTIRGMEPLGRGDLLVLRPGTWHAYERSQHLDIFNVCFGSELLRYELAWMIEEPPLAHLFWSGPLRVSSRNAKSGDGYVQLKLSSVTTQRCERHLHALIASLRDSNAGRSAHIGGLLYFLDEIGKAVPAEACAHAFASVHPAVVHGMRLLEDDLVREWTLGDLATAVHVDRSYLVRLFRSTTGLPPMAYLARCRAERAAGLLLKTDKDIADIGAEVGWPEPYYFARRFKFHFGMSASRYRDVASQSVIARPARPAPAASS